MTTPTNEEVRRQFEAEARRHCMDLTPHPGRDGWRYADKDTDLFRAGYQAALSSPAVAGLVDALRGVIAVADRKTDEFDNAKAALAQYATLAGESHD
jgi:hypothetical protein